MKSLVMAFALLFSVPAFAESELKESKPTTSETTKVAVSAEDKALAKQKNKEGLALLRQKKFYEASELFYEAIDLNPKNAGYHNNLGLALLKDGDPYSAQPEFQAALDLGLNKAFVWNNLGMAYEHMNYLDEARSAYLRASQKGSQAADRNYQRIKDLKSIYPEGGEFGCGGPELPEPILAPTLTEPAVDKSAEPALDKPADPAPAPAAEPTPDKI